MKTTGINLRIVASELNVEVTVDGSVYREDAPSVLPVAAIPAASETVAASRPPRGKRSRPSRRR